MTHPLSPKGLEAAARAHDAEDAAQKGEPSPWLDEFGGLDAEWKAERLACMEVALAAYYQVDSVSACWKSALEKIARGEVEEIEDGETLVVPMSAEEAAEIASAALSRHEGEA